MADNVPITAGSGTNIATDDVSGVHYPYVKLTASAADSTEPLSKAEDAAHSSGQHGIMALGVRKDAATMLADTDADYVPPIFDAQGRLWVRPAPVQVRISVTPTISSGSAYASGDCVGGLQTVGNAARASGGSGIVQSILVLDKSQAQRAAMDLLFFDRSVTAQGDNVAVAISDADMAFCLGVVTIGPYNTAWPGTPLNSFSTLVNVGLPFVLNGADLYVQAVVRGTPTYTSTTDLLFIYGILQD